MTRFIPLLLIITGCSGTDRGTDPIDTASVDSPDADTDTDADSDVDADADGDADDLARERLDSGGGFGDSAFGESGVQDSS